jgi:transposase
MSKYDLEFKLQVVQQYLGGQGFRVVSQQNGLAHSQVRRWVKTYQAHGKEGLAKKFSHYSAQFKLSVLQHMWDNHLSPLQAAATFNIRNPPIVRVWERSYLDGGIAALEPRPRGRPRQKMNTPPDKPLPPADEDRRSREQLLEENEYLRAEVAYLKKLDALLQAKKQAAAQKKKRK